MKLYKLTRNNAVGYDENAGFMIAANDEQQARVLASYAVIDEPSVTWIDPTLSACIQVGTATRGTKAGIVLTDFNAG